MAKLLHSLVNALTKLISSPVEELGRAEKSLRYAIELSRHCARELRKDRATQMAAALTYYSLFSLLPTLVLMLAVLTTYKGLDEQRVAFRKHLIQILLPPIEDGAPSLPALDINGPRLRLKTLSGTGVSPVVGLQGRLVSPIGRFETEPNTQDNLKPRDEENPLDTQNTLDAQSTLDVQNTLDPQNTLDSKNPLMPTAGESHVDNVEKVREARRQLASTLQSVMDQLEQLDFGKIGVVGLLVFLFASTTLLTTIERSFNLIFSVDRRRPIYLRLPMYYTILTLAPLVLIAGQILQKMFFHLITVDTGMSWAYGSLVLLSPLFTTWLVFFAMYKLLPYTFVSVRAAMVGSFTSAILWTVGQQLFTIYVVKAAGATVYGALALLPLLLLWLWLTWLIILFGLELVYALQSLKGKLALEQDSKRQSQLVGDPIWVLPMMSYIARAFQRGDAVDVGQMAEHLRLPVVSIEKFSQHFEEQGLLHAVQSQGHLSRPYTLARPPSEIQINQLLELGRNLVTDANDLKNVLDWQPVHQCIQSQQQWADQMTLQTIIQQSS